MRTIITRSLRLDFFHYVECWFFNWGLRSSEQTAQLEEVLCICTPEHSANKRIIKRQQFSIHLDISTVKFCLSFLDCMHCHASGILHITRDLDMDTRLMLEISSLGALMTWRWAAFYNISRVCPTLEEAHRHIFLAIQINIMDILLLE